MLNLMLQSTSATQSVNAEAFPNQVSRLVKMSMTFTFRLIKEQFLRRTRGIHVADAHAQQPYRLPIRRQSRRKQFGRDFPEHVRAGRGLVQLLGTCDGLKIRETHLQMNGTSP